jgi:ABC-2 type transport system permease protein
MMREIVKHLKLWVLLVKMNVMSQLEYRANFVTGVMMELGYLIVKILYVVVAYSSGKEIAGYSADEILVFIGSFVLLTGFYAGIFMMNLFQLSNLVRDGSFDMLLTKPVSIQFLATLRRSDFGLFLVDAGAGIVMVAIGLSRLGGGFDPLKAIGFAAFVASGAAVAYAIYLIPMTFVFRIVNASSIAGLADSFWDFNNVPMVVYGRTGRFVGTFLFPIFVVTNFPALFALDRMEPVLAAWGILAPFLFVYLSTLFWRSGIKHYASGGN